MGRLVLAAVSVFLVVVATAAGAPAFGKLAMMAGWPRIALPLLEDPAARAAALYRVGRYEEADGIYERIGRPATFNRGVTLAVTGDHKLALAYFKATLFATPEDEDARFNRDLLATIVKPVTSDKIVPGRIKTAAEKAKERAVTAAQINDLYPVLTRETREQARRPVSASAAEADDAWLANLPDNPGEFLKKRLAAEFEQRVEVGGAFLNERNPW